MSRLYILPSPEPLGTAGMTKEEIAAVLAARFAELVPRLPPMRKVWMSEDHRMAIFDAASFALTHFHERNQRKRAA